LVQANPHGNRSARKREASVDAHDSTDHGRTLKTVFERLSSRRWRVTISVVQPGGGDVDSAVPMIDLGVFRSKRAATSAATMVLESWVWEPLETPVLVDSSTVVQPHQAAVSAGS
jgi:hypothetical protein